MSDTNVEQLMHLRRVAEKTFRAESPDGDRSQVFAEDTRAVRVEWLDGSRAPVVFERDQGVGVTRLQNGRWSHSATAAQYPSSGLADVGSVLDTWVSDEVEDAVREANAACSEAGSFSLRVTLDVVDKVFAVRDRDTLTASARWSCRTRVEWVHKTSRGPVRVLVSRSVSESAGVARAISGATREALDQGRQAAAARTVRTRATPVVFSAGVSASFLHELVGHGLEDDHFLKTTGYVEGLRRHRFHPGLELTDEAQRTELAGSYAIDDDGLPAGAATTLVSAGRVQRPITSQRSAAASGSARSANGRRQSFRHPSLPRTSNTILRAVGVVDSLTSLESGPDVLVVEALTGGHVNTATGTFQFTGALGVHVSLGRRRPVRDVHLRGDGLAVLSRIEGFGPDATGIDGTCGKGRQTVPVGFFSPSVRFAMLEWSAA